MQAEKSSGGSGHTNRIPSWQGQESEQGGLVSAVAQYPSSIFTLPGDAEVPQLHSCTSLTWTASSVLGWLVEGGKREVLTMLCARKLEIWIKELSWDLSVKNSSQQWLAA